MKRIGWAIQFKNELGKWEMCRYAMESKFTGEGRYFDLFFLFERKNDAREYFQKSNLSPKQHRIQKVLITPTY